MASKQSDDDLLSGTHDAEYEEKFVKEHRKHSFFSSLYFTIAGATFIGVLGTFVSNLMNVRETQAVNLMRKSAGQTVEPWEEARLFKDKSGPAMMGAMMAVGVLFTYLSNKRETEKVRLEDMRLARRFNKDKALYHAEGGEAPAQGEDTDWRQSVTRQRKQSDYELAR